MRGTDRILIVEGSGRGFLSHYAHALALGLHERGHQVRLITATCDELAGWQAPFARKAILRPGLAGWLTLRRDVRDFNPQVLHFQWLSDPISAAVFVHWAQRRGAVALYTPHNLLPHRGRWVTMPLFRRLYRAFDRVVVRDSSMRWAASEFLDLDPDRMSMALGSPNIIAHPQAPRQLPPELAPRRAGEIRVLHFGHGNPRKGLGPLLGALAQMPCPPALHLVLAGAGVARGLAPEVLAAVRGKLRLSVIDRYLAPEETGALFAEADLLTMPYTKLCRSPILDLAAAFATPVLRTARVEATEFDEGQHGITIAGGDFAGFATALTSLAAAPARLRAMRAALQRGPGFATRVDQLAATHDAIYARAVLDRAARRHGKAPQPLLLLAGE
jgi:glycosyltransferase involved in cell wall biosynthesis